MLDLEESPEKPQYNMATPPFLDKPPPISSKHFQISPPPFPSILKKSNPPPYEWGVRTMNSWVLRLKKLSPCGGPAALSLYILKISNY